MKINVIGCCDKAGNSYGYTMAHEQILFALKKCGFDVNSDDADTVLHVCTPSAFKPISGKKNILYTMFEFDSVPIPWVKHLQQADCIFTPSSYCKELFKKYTQSPIYVIPHFVNPCVGHYERVRTTPFIWLWVGAINVRKGYYHLAKAWELLGEERPDIIKDSILIYKSTSHQISGVAKIDDNVILDVRKLPFDGEGDTLLGLYQKAHAFIFPSLGEGWGLTLHEAQATGLPCIYPRTTGMQEFGYGFTLKTKPVEINLEIDVHKFVTFGAEPIVESIAYNMTYIYDNYDKALTVGKDASEIALKFNFDNTCKILKSVFADIK